MGTKKLKELDSYIKNQRFRNFKINRDLKKVMKQGWEYCCICYLATTYLQVV